ncbi:hypothetical protein WJX81_004242 [Elliptochloris bilobata]|uniref:Probable magnesium transporter n=1 Tax=Elliptochloris bilobata TaxID=381761 RepID=A0AAW1RR31_9CHLO
MWFAIFLTIVASTGNNIGKALQKEATTSLPRFSLDPNILRQYFRSRQWLSGLAADLGGALFMVAAFALAPVSLVQPVSGVGLVSLAVFSHFWLKERLNRSEWGAVAIAALGTIGIGATAEAAPPGQSAPSGARMVGVLAGLALALLGTFLAQRRGIPPAGAARRRAPAAVKQAAAWCGLQAGACFGLSAAACRTGFLLAARSSWLAAPAGLGASAAFTSAGFMLQTVGLKDGNTVVLCTCAAVSSMVTGVLVGMLALGEGLPSSRSLGAARLLSWLLLIVGVSALANGQGGLREMAQQLAAAVPKQALAQLPPRAALYLRALSQRLRSGELPTIAVASEA